MRPQCMLSCFSHVQFWVTLWTVAHQAPLSMGFPRQEYWRELPCPLAGDLPHPEMEPMSLMSPILASGFFTTSTTWEALRPWCWWFNCSVVSYSFVTSWTVARQAPLSMGFSRQEYWRELPCPPPGDLPDSGIEPVSLTSPAVAGRFFTSSGNWEAPKRTGVPVT